VGALQWPGPRPPLDRMLSVVQAPAVLSLTSRSECKSSRQYWTTGPLRENYQAMGILELGMRESSSELGGKAEKDMS
jgi:hypothetical protein